MSDIPPTSTSFFGSSNVIITGGSLTMNNSSTQVHTGGKNGFNCLVEAAAPNALHDSGHIVDPPKCHPGTRVAIIQTLMDWIAGSDEHTRDKFITWVSGAAGAGKSAIGRTVCECCAKDGSLLAGFFFSANDPTRNNSKSLVPTISYQICALTPHMRRLVSEFVDFDPLIFTRSLQMQFMSLVIDPLLANYAKSPESAPRLIVLDGLDECLDLPSQRDILDVLYYIVTTSPIPIRILVLSRPESNISNTFSGTKINSTLFKIFLGTEYRPNDDIRHYLCDCFTELREGHIFKASIPYHWPTEEHLSALVDKASGQFIYAKTVIGYLNSPRHRPHQRLDAVLGLRPPFKDLPFSELDALYTHLLNNTDNPALSADIMAFLALYGDITPSVIDVYLNLEDGTAEVVLSDLTAIVRVFTSANQVQQAVLLHKSFGDFLFDAHRSKDLAKKPVETHVGNLVRLIEIFTEGHNRPRRLSNPEDENMLRPFVTSFYGYNLFKRSYAAFFFAVTNFSVEFYCKSLFQQQVWEKVENIFLDHMFRVIFNFEADGRLAEGTYHNHALTYYNLALFELRNRYSNDWEMHYIFATCQLRIPGPRAVPSKGLGSAFYHIHLHPTKFLIPLCDEDKSLIISKAAVYYLTFLVDSSLTNHEAESHLTLHWIDRKQQQNCPWKWHRRTSSHNMPNKLLLGQYSSRNRGRSVRLIPYAKLINVVAWEIFPLQSIQKSTQWKLGLFEPDQRLWYKYRQFLNDLPQILPLAARLPILVDLCRTKCFAKMSIMFPKLRRRARRAMTTYLDRVGAGLDDGLRAA